MVDVDVRLVLQVNLGRVTSLFGMVQTNTDLSRRNTEDVGVVTFMASPRALRFVPFDGVDQVTRRDVFIIELSGESSLHFGSW